MIDKEKSGMKSGNKSIRINGKSVEVTDEVYKIYQNMTGKCVILKKTLNKKD